MDICSEVEWYKLAHLAWPSATHIIDVGANKGYLGSLFLALWGGNGLGLSPAVIFDHATRLNTWKNSRNPAGYCKARRIHSTNILISYPKVVRMGTVKECSYSALCNSPVTLAPAPATATRMIRSGL